MGSADAEKGCAWSPGSGRYAKIHHPWVYGAPPIWRYQGCSNNDCAAKLRKENGDWNLDACKEWFSDESVQKFSTIKAMDAGYDDLIVWKEDRGGIYTVRSGYKTLLEDNQRQEKKLGINVAHNINWKQLWRKNGSPKQKIFLWKILKGALSLGSERKKRGLGVHHHCSLCCIDEDPSSCELETLEHLFRDCNFASHVWKGCRFGINVSNQNNIPLAEWIFNWMRILSDKGRDLGESYQLFLACLDCIWGARNNKIFKNLMPSPGSAILSMERRVSNTHKKMEDTERKMLQNSDDRQFEPPGFERQKGTDTRQDKHHLRNLELVTGNGVCNTATLGIYHTRSKGREFKWHWVVKQVGSTLEQGELQQARQNREADILQTVLDGLQGAWLKLWHLQIKSTDQNILKWMQPDYNSIQGDGMIKGKINELLPYFHCGARRWLLLTEMGSMIVPTNHQFLSISSFPWPYSTISGGFAAEINEKPKKRESNKGHC